MNQDRLRKAIAKYSEDTAVNPMAFEDAQRERSERKEYYRSFDKKKLAQISEEEFAEFYGKLWAMRMWGNKQYRIDEIIRKNGFEKITSSLAELLYGPASLARRWDTFLDKVKGVGPATISELLSYIDSDTYAILNRTTISSLEYLEVKSLPKHNYQNTGEKYEEICGIVVKIAKTITEQTGQKTDLLAADYFFWDILLPLSKSEALAAIGEREISDTLPIAKSKHDELIEKIVEIGALLGFESRSEIKVAKGAKVDAVWEAKIGNMGKVIYVFEVQSRGSIDSLILNLKKAQSNAAVQAVVAVSDEQQIENIREESIGVIEERSLRTWSDKEVSFVYDSLISAHESINRLQLVPESFL